MGKPGKLTTEALISVLREVVNDLRELDPQILQGAFVCMGDSIKKIEEEHLETISMLRQVVEELKHEEG